jgi:protein O-mannosyl-transferase
METAPSRGAKACIKWLLPLSFIAIIFAVYSNTFTSPPFLDDFHSFVFEKSMYLQQLSVSSILSLFHTKFGYTRSIPVITLALNHKLGNSNLIYFHLVNITIHALSFLAVYFLTRQIISIAKKRNADTFSNNVAGLLPICVAALWALNPVQTNAVTYLVQRMASIQALFYVLAVGFYMKGRLSSSAAGTRKKAAAWYTAFLLSSICAFLSKENSVVLPVMIVVVEIWFFDSELVNRAWHSLRRISWLTWLILGLVGVATSIYGFTFLYSNIAEGYAKRHFTMPERLLTEGRIVIWYISLLLWPIPGRLSMEHDVTLSVSLLNPLSTLFSLLTIAALFGGSIYFRKKYPIITFGILWYFLNLAIESTILPLELVFEHRLYLPSFGLFLAEATILAVALRYCFVKLSEADFAKVLTSLIILVACCSAMLTFLRNEDWEDMATIHYDCAVKAPASPRAQGNYANVLLKIAQPEEAIKYGEKALQLGKPGLEVYGLAANAIVTALSQLGKYDEAVARGEELLANQPKNVDGDSHPYLCVNLAQTYMSLDREQDAYRQILEAFKYVELTDKSIYKKQMVCSFLQALLQRCQSKEIDLNGDGIPDPGNIPINLWIARELQKTGDFAFSKQLIEQEYAQNPDNIEVAKVIEESHKEDALNLVQSRNWDFSKKYVHRPFSRFNFCMAVAFLVQERQMPEAFMKIGRKFMNWALQLDPNSPDALLLSGWYAFNDDKTEEAIALERKALERDPDNAKIWVALGVFLPKAGQANEALAALAKVVELYPGYPKRQILEGVCDELRKEAGISPVTENRDNSSMKAEVQQIPSS